MLWCSERKVERKRQTGCWDVADDGERASGKHGFGLGTRRDRVAACTQERREAHSPAAGWAVEGCGRLHRGTQIGRSNRKRRKHIKKKRKKEEKKKTHHIGHETHQKEKETTEKVLLERWKAMQSTIESVVRQAFAAFAAAVVQSRSVPALPPTHPIETFVCTISSFPAHFHNTPFQSP